MKRNLKAAFAAMLALCMALALVPFSALPRSESKAESENPRSYIEPNCSVADGEIDCDYDYSSFYPYEECKLAFHSAGDNRASTRYTVLVLDTADEATFLNGEGETLYVAGTAIEYVKRASSRFISCLSEASGNNYLAVVSYSQYASLVSGFSQDFDYIDGRIQQLTASTSLRNMSSALDEAYSLLNAVDDSTAIKSVVLFSTGMVNEGPYNYNGEFDEHTVGSRWRRSDNGIHLYAYANYALERAAIIKNAGMYLYSIGLFQSFDGMPEEGHDVAALFQLTANALATSDEYYYPTDNPDELEIIFEEVILDMFPVNVNYVLSPGSDEFGDHTQPMGVFSVKFDDNWFTVPSTTFNYDLAKASLAAAAGSFSEKKADERGDYYIRENLRAFKFNEDSIATWKFFDNTSIANTCGHAFAIKELPNGDYLIAAAIRSSGYGSEWESNFNAVSEDNSYQFTFGFKEAADQVYEHLNNYIDYYCSKLDIGREKIHIWTFGFSRGGAIAGLLAARLNEQSGISKDQIVAYTFEAPKNVLRSSRVMYDNIFNILQETDLVPHVPLRTWDYTWYGNNYYLPSMTKSGSNFWRKFDAMNVCFDQIMVETGRPSIDYTLGWSQELSIDLILDYLDDVVRTRFNYRDHGWQEIDRDFGAVFMGHSYSLRTLFNLLIPGNEAFVDHLCSMFENWDSLSFFQKCSELRRLLKDIRNITFSNTFGNNNIVAFRMKDVLTNYFTNLAARFIKQINPFDNQKYIDNYVNSLELVFVDGLRHGMNGKLFMQHWPETIMAWLNSASDASVFERSSYKRVSLKCPIDVYIYDSSNTVVGRIINEIVDDSIDERVYCACDLLGEKTVFLPDDDTYRIEIVAREDGEFDLINDYFSEDRYLEVAECYINVQMSEGQRFTAIFTQNAQESTLSTDGAEIPPDYTSENGETIPEFFVELICEGLGSVGGEGYYTLGQTVTLSAVELFDSTFAGWYNEQNELISTELVYNFSITSDGVYTGVFLGGEETDPEPVTPVPGEPTPGPNEPTPVPAPGDTTPGPNDPTPIPAPGDNTPAPNDPTPTTAPIPPTPNTGTISVVGIGITALITGIGIVRSKKKRD